MNSLPEELDEADFERIEAAVMETERGRWFLQEYARRRCAVEAERILAAIARLEARACASEEAWEAMRREAARAALDFVETLAEITLGSSASSEPSLPPPADSSAAAQLSLEADNEEADRRLAALRRLDALAVEAKVKLFG